MITRDVDFLPHKGDGCVSSNSSALVDQLCSRTGNTVFKSGPLFISSKGIGWTSWKKRWFILTRTSLVFFRNDPNALSQKGSEVNLTLGGIDLNNSGSVVVRADKKLLTVLFPDGRDGRAFTLKAETSEDMYEWKTALENALAQAPSAVLVMGQNGFFRNDAANAFEGSFEQWRVKRNVKSLVVGRPILLVLEDIDGCPSFLEKALRFIEQYGVKVEGILRQAADVDEVERRIQEYEHGKNEFSADEDAHVIADCVKYVLRELPSSPVPAACCSSLLEAFRSNRGSRVTAFCAVIFDAFPEPNRRLLQRILKMMQTVASHKAQNLMSTSAVAACMAPLLLRPLLAGDCDSSDDFDMGADGSMQLLQAAAAANHAQAIIVTLLEEFDNIFLDKGSFSPALCSQSDGSGSEDKDSTDDEILEENGYHDVQNDIDPDIDHERSLSGLLSESSGSGSSEIYNNKALEGLVSDLESPKVDDKASKPILTSLPQCDSVQIGCNLWNRSDNCYAMTTIEPHEGYLPTSTSPKPKLRQREHTSTSTGLSPSSCITTKSTNKYDEYASSIKRPAIWDRSSARKNLSAESIEYSSDDEMMIQRLEMSKTDLQNRIAKEEKGNAILHASLERRKQALHERRLTLEQDVLKLQVQLQKERDLRTRLEAGLNIPLGQLCISSTLDSKTRVELEEIALAEADVVNLKKKVADLHLQLNQQHQHNYGPLSESFGRNHFSFNYQSTMNFEHRETESTDTTDTVFHCGRFPGSEPSQTQQQNPISKNSDKCSGASASFSEEPLTVGPGNWSASSGRDEGMVSAQSALIKLTNRLSFLKERRSHLVNELQTIEIRSIPISDGPPFTGAPQWAITR